MQGELEPEDVIQFRRESDRLLGALVTRLKTIEDWQDQHTRDYHELRCEVQKLRDVKNQSTGVLLAIGTLAPLIGAVIYWLAEKAFDFNNLCR